MDDKIKFTIVWAALAWIFMFIWSAFNWTSAKIATVEMVVVETWVTVEEEIESQLEFAENSKKEIKEGNLHEESNMKRQAFGNPEVSEEILARLRFKKYHTTFNRNMEMELKYNVWGEGEIQDIINYAYQKTKDLPHPTLGVLWKEMVKTRSMENDRYSPMKRWNWDERGICQLRYLRHSPYMDSPEFADPYGQIDYCVDVYLDRYHVKRHNGQKLQNVWSAWTVKDRAKSRFIFF